MNPSYLLVTCVMLFTMVALSWDIRTNRIPNWLNVTALVAALLFHVCTAGWAGLGTAAGGFAVGFGILLVLWLIGGGGGGDVKFMGALGAWLGPMPTLFVFLLSTFMAVLCLMCLTVWQHLAPAKVATATQGSASHGKNNANAATHDRARMTRRTLPYAVPASLATWAVLVIKTLTDGSI